MRLLGCVALFIFGFALNATRVDAAGCDPTTTVTFGDTLIRSHTSTVAYVGTSECVWVIRGNVSHIPKLQLFSFDLDSDLATLVIHDGNSVRGPVAATLTGSITDQTLAYISNTTALYVVFDAGGTNTLNKTGFLFNVSFVSPPTPTTAPPANSIYLTNELDVTVDDASVPFVYTIRSHYQTNPTLLGLPSEVDTVFVKFIVVITSAWGESYTLTVPTNCTQNINAVYRQLADGTYTVFTYNSTDITGYQLNTPTAGPINGYEDDVCSVKLHLKDDGRGESFYTQDSPGTLIAHFAFVHSSNLSATDSPYGLAQKYVLRHDMNVTMKNSSHGTVLFSTWHTEKATAQNPIGELEFGIALAADRCNKTTSVIVPYDCVRFPRIRRCLKDERDGNGLYDFRWDGETGCRFLGRDPLNSSMCLVEVFIHDGKRGDADKETMCYLHDPLTLSVDDDPSYSTLDKVKPWIATIVIGGVVFILLIAGGIYMATRQRSGGNYGRLRTSYP